MARAFTIREATAADRPAILSVVAAAFGRRDEAAIVEKLWADNASAPDLVADAGGEVIGHCAVSAVHADPALARAAFGLAPIAVLPTRQKSGVGAAMVRAAVDHCRAKGAALLVLLGAPAYYGRFGFIPASRKGLRWAAMDAGDAFQLIDFAGLDGTPRAIHYHEAFG